nr:hypothetical protein [Tanacetum cinerariifolium]
MLCKPRPNSNELKRVAIGYKNPLCLTRAKQAQLALYNGHEIIKENHIQGIVHNSEDTLEIAEITRKKMNDKMNDPESLKERTKVSRPIKAFMVYPLNTPASLVPKVLPTKSQVKILIFTLIQLFSEFDQTCKKRITPSAITDGERGFEQTKACYLQEVIPFFKTLKDNFEGIQKALTKEVKEMKDVFEELEAEVAQHAVFRKHDAIELKNLLIANDNLIAECLSQELKYQDLKDQIGNSPPTPDKDTPDFDSVFTTDSQITKLTNQVTHLQAQNDLFRAENDKIKQHYKELYDFIKITRAKHIKQELLEYAIGTYPYGSQPRAKQLAHIPLIRKKQVIVAQSSNKLDSTTHPHVATVTSQKINVPMPPSTGVDYCPIASGSQPLSHVKPNRISPAK